MDGPLPGDETFAPASVRIAAMRRVYGAEIVDEGIQLARQNYGTLVLAILLPQLPVFGIDLWKSSQRGPFALWLALLLSVICASLANASAARVVMDALEGRPADLARVFRIVLRRAWPVVFSGLYRAIFFVLGLVIVLIPGLYVLSVYALVPVLPVLEPEIGGWEALRRSATLTSRARLLAFGAYVVPYGFVTAAVWASAMLTTRIAGPHVGRLLGSLLGSSLAVALRPFLASIQVRLYVELRMRKEAIDIEWALAPASTASAS